jgi:hypothetical protein
VHLYHRGIRYNREDWINAADTAFAPLWFANKSSNYAKLQVLARLDKSMLNEGVQQLLEQFSVYSRTDTLGTYQGLDAFLEEIHKEATKFLPNSPTEEHWKRAFINLQYYLKLKKLLKSVTERVSPYSIKRRRYPIIDDLYHRLMSYYCTDELDNTNGVLKSEDVAPEVHKFSLKGTNL